MQPQRQGGGPPFGAPPPEIAPFLSSSSGSHMLGFSTSDHHPPPEAASPRPPAALSQHDQSFEELVPDEQALAAGEGSAAGNRWPRQETLALLKIRSEMDGAFRDATLKSPLWDDVSRKLAELGYTRSAKKCKEKFENVHKYYKRTKEGRAARQDGKAYRFFNQLEALGGATTTITMSDPAIAAISGSTTAPISPLPITGTSGAGVQLPTFFTPVPPLPATGLSGLGYSSDTFSTSSYDSDDGGTEEGGGGGSARKRKRAGGSRKLVSFFEGMMKQVVERQEAMQRRFLETIEKREQDRMIREEAWKRQEMARLNREHELLAQERAMAASRDAHIISFLQKMTGAAGQTIQVPPAVSVLAAPPPPVTPNPPPSQTEQHYPKPQPPPPQPPQQTSQQQDLPPEIVRKQQQTPQASSAAPVPAIEPHESSSRWPKSEVHALIKLRSGLDPRYQEAGPKGQLWEEISAGMQRMGYNRSSKRCKEKWENINKYFKKVKESNKKRPEDAKTCPYFHQLDALYRRKIGGGGADAGLFPRTSQESPAAAPNPIPQEPAQIPQEGIQIPTSNGGLPPAFLDQGGGGGGGAATVKKPEDIMKELIDQQIPTIDDYDSDNNLDDEDDDGKTRYEIQFQRQNTSDGRASAAPAKAASSCLAMAQLANFPS